MAVRFAAGQSSTVVLDPGTRAEDRTVRDSITALCLPPASDGREQDWTDFDTTVLNLLLDGLDDAAIALRLGVSVPLVEQSVVALGRHWTAISRMQAAVVAITRHFTD